MNIRHCLNTALTLMSMAVTIALMATAVKCRRSVPLDTRIGAEESASPDASGISPVDAGSPDITQTVSRRIISGFRSSSAMDAPEDLESLPDLDAAGKRLSAADGMPSAERIAHIPELTELEASARYSASRYRYAHRGILSASDVMKCWRILIEMEFRNYHLSLQEKQVALNMIYSDSNQNIGDKLFMSLSKVKYHVRSIFKKTECDNRGMFVRLILAGVENSDHSWKDRVDLKRDIERFGIV